MWHEFYRSPLPPLQVQERISLDRRGSEEEYKGAGIASSFLVSIKPADKLIPGLLVLIPGKKDNRGTISKPQIRSRETAGRSHFVRSPRTLNFPAGPNCFKGEASMAIALSIRLYTARCGSGKKHSMVQGVAPGIAPGSAVIFDRMRVTD